MKDTRDSIDFAKTDVARLYRKFLFPTLLGLVFTVCFTLADGIIVGQYLGSDSLAAINIVAPLFLIGSGTGLLFGTGVSVVASIHMAKKNYKAARIVVTQSFVVSSIIVILLSSLIIVYSTFVGRLLGSSESLLPLVKNYMGILAPSLFLMVILNIGIFVIRLDGSPKYAMYSDAISSVLNIALDYIFVVYFHWGLKGAALATLIGVFTGAILMLYYLTSKHAFKLRLYKLKHTWTSFFLTIRNTRYMVKIGTPTFVGEAAIALMMLIGNYVFRNMLGDDGVAAFSVVCYYMPIIFMINDGIIQSAQPIVSYNHTLRNHKRIKKAIRLAYGSAISVSIILTLLYIFEGNILISLFLKKESPAFAIALKGIPLFGYGNLFLALNVVTIGYYQCVKREKEATLISSLRGFVFITLCFLIVPKLLGVTGIWLAIPIAEFLTFIFILIYADIKKKPLYKTI
ncbi:MAG: MATE family efflux transporter [Bacteroidales bacterium]